ncbi:MAG: hypothetical protein Q8M22_00420 [Actinomycetota bacterium]|nr:hypothetical protein [Actinomycetota bacterium]
MPVNFQNSSTVTVRSPDGRWYEVRIVADDGHQPWPPWLLSGHAGVLVFGSLYALYRLGLRAWYVVRRSTKKRIEVSPWAGEGQRPHDRARPLLRESRSDEASARERATELHAALSEGTLGW